MTNTFKKIRFLQPRAVPENLKGSRFFKKYNLNPSQLSYKEMILEFKKISLAKKTKSQDITTKKTSSEIDKKLFLSDV